MSKTEKPDLKDVLNIDEVLAEGYKKICIYAGTGAGKSTWVKEVLSKKGSVLFVTSRKATVAQDLKKSSFTKFYKAHKQDNQTLLTNAGLEFLIENLKVNGSKEIDDFLDAYDFIVIDEIHSIATDSTFAGSSMSVLSFVEYAVENQKVVIVMTGTPEPIESYLIENKWHIINYIDVCKYVHPDSVYFIKQKNIEKCITENVSGNRKVVCFINHVSTIVEIYTKLIQKFGFTFGDIAVVVADNKKSELYKNIQKNCKKEIESVVKQYFESNNIEIDKNEINKEIKKEIGNKPNEIRSFHEEVYTDITSVNKIPASCKVVLSTSTLREGVNIFNTDITIICDNHILSNLIQFFGRVRVNGAKVYMVEDSKPHDITQDEWLYNYASWEVDTANTYLDMLDKEDLISYLEERTKLRRHIKECNKYIYFDCIKEKFKISYIRFNEEERLLANSNWVRKLQYYCGKYDIHCSPVTVKKACKNILPSLLEKLADREIKLFEKNKESVVGIINDAYSTNCKQISKVNDLLNSKGFLYEFNAYKETKGVRRDKTYWMLKNRK